MRKYIVKHSTTVGNYANGYIIANHYDHSIQSFQKLCREAKKSFPTLKAENTECRTVIESRWCKRCPVIRFSLPPDIAIPEGWSEVEELPDVVIGY